MSRAFENRNLKKNCARLPLLKVKFLSGYIVEVLLCLNVIHYDSGHSNQRQKKELFSEEFFYICQLFVVAKPKM